jgi:GTP-binding protein
VSKVQRAAWENMIEAYLRKRKQLFAVLQLVDSRLEPQKSDLEFFEKLVEWQVPIAVVFTKADKNKRQDLAKNTRDYMQTLVKTWKATPPAFITSAETGEGRDKLWQYMQIHMPPEVGGAITRAV